MAERAVGRLKVLVYSSDVHVRRVVINVLGPSPAAAESQVEYLEVASEPALVRTVDAGGVDLVILDGEAAPAGGMGICRQLKDEVDPCPPILLIVRRSADAWLATWSRADAVAPWPLDPLEFHQSAAKLLGGRVGTSTRS